MGEILTMQTVSEWRRRNPGPLTLTNGCFDILHYGHVRYLRDARTLTGSLIVGVNSDRAVKLLKGANRPINEEFTRMFVVAELRCVACVCLVDDTRMVEFIRAVKPTVWAKGGDYTLDSLDAGEVAAAREVQAAIEILPLIPGHSTTEILSHRT